MRAPEPFYEPGGNEAPVSTFRERRLPVPARLAGYSALMQRFNLPVPLHHEMAAVAARNTSRKEDGWNIYPASLQRKRNAIDHFVFALRYEGVHLLTLKEAFLRFDKRELETAARAKPTSAYLRRLCFFYEWLTNDTLDLPATRAGVYADALDATRQYATESSLNSPRFRIRNNLPGGPDFCPVVFRTPRLDAYIGSDLSAKARHIVASAPKELIARAAAFLLLSDSKASFAIEGERPPKDRIARWGGVVGRSGQLKLSLDQLVRLQRDLIGDARFVKVGLREEGGFVGRHDAFAQPVPEHISARHEDIVDLLQGLIRFNAVSASLGFHPVLAAACIAFGFVYIHPFEDGNGRIHRFLMHHVLAERRFTPEEIVFPISSVILDDVARYKEVLERVSRPLLDWIEWRATDQGNIMVHGETADYYRYFDATAHSEFLFRCIERAVEKDLPEELALLENRDRFHRRIALVVDMPERTMDLLLHFLRQNHGRLSGRALKREFAALSNVERTTIEKLYADLFS